MSLNKLTIAAARDALKAGEVTSVEITEACLAEIDAAGALNAFCAKTPEIALAQAKAADARIKAGDAPAMCGIPLGIKDLFCTKGVASQAASRILEGFKPEYESTVTQNLWDAGAVMLGKLSMDEFAMGSSNETACYGPVVSPWKVDDRQLTPGGSSGGSAAAVAADLCLAATGTDTGGSIRQPAAFTGIVGIKPTYGRVSRWGVVAFASSLDQAGPMTKSVRDAAIMLSTMASNDAKDSTCADIPVPDFEAALTGDIRGKKIGIPREYRMEGMPAEIEKLWSDGAAMLRDAGAEIVEISLPHTKYALPAYYVIAPAEASSNLSRFDGIRYGLRAPHPADIPDLHRRSRELGFGPEVKRRILLGTCVLSAGYHDACYHRAQQVRTLIRRDFERAFQQVDALLTPVAPAPARRLGANTDPLTEYLSDIFTLSANLAGICAVSVPAGHAEADGGSRLPVGLQILGPPLAEPTILRVARAAEHATP